MDSAVVTQRSRTPNVMSWVLQILAAAMFLFAGFSKIGGAPLMVQQFGLIGLGQWFRYLTGAIEVVSAVLLLVPGFALYGSVALAITMVGAIVTHLVILGGSAVPAIVLLAATSGIAIIRRSER